MKIKESIKSINDDIKLWLDGVDWYVVWPLVSAPLPLAFGFALLPLNGKDCSILQNLAKIALELVAIVLLLVATVRLMRKVARREEANYRAQLYRDDELRRKIASLLEMLEEKEREKTDTGTNEETETAEQSINNSISTTNQTICKDEKDNSNDDGGSGDSAGRL